MVLSDSSARQANVFCAEVDAKKLGMKTGFKESA
jgi:hypothetical protein